MLPFRQFNPMLFVELTEVNIANWCYEGEKALWGLGEEWLVGVSRVLPIHLLWTLEETAEGALEKRRQIM